MLNRKDIRVRDPFILLDGDTYYLYCTASKTTLSYYTSHDLENWEMGGIAFEIPENFWAYRDVWAAEVHAYRGKFYLFVSLLGHSGLRGTQIAVADHPSGPFLPLVDRPVTPLDQSCIDGTLFVHQGIPYILYSRDWPDHYVEEKGAFVGQICLARLRNDLHQILGQPLVLFDSDEVPISRATPDHWLGSAHNVICNSLDPAQEVLRYGSDAPFVQTLSDGRLLLTWSPYLNGNYVVLGAISETGDIHGPWAHLSQPIFDRNGGHAMFFRDKSGTLIMCLHAPESKMLERACLFQMGERDGILQILKEI